MTSQSVQRRQGSVSQQVYEERRARAAQDVAARPDLNPMFAAMLGESLRQQERQEENLRRDKEA